MATVQRLDFDGNGLLFGAIPTTLGNLNQLEEIDFGSNMFSGVIPEQLFSATNLILIDLDNNNITGTIPSAIGNLQDLDTLQLDSNFLTGTLESRIGDLSLLSKCREWRVPSGTTRNATLVLTILLLVGFDYRILYLEQQRFRGTDT